MALIPASASPAAMSLGGSCASRSIEVELAPSTPGYNPSGTATISMNDPAVRNLLGKPSSGSAISFYCAYGKSNRFVFCIGTTTNACLARLAINAGWPQNTGLTAVIPSCSVVYSTSHYLFGLVIGGCFPQGVILVNNGYIVGKGGTGGMSNWFACRTNYPLDGQPGGGALNTITPVTIVNNGVIGGGGGGGGSAYIGDRGVYQLWDSAGGGGAGYGCGGLHSAYLPTPRFTVTGCNSTAGSLTGGGSNPQAYIVTTSPIDHATRTIRGGPGGSLGAAGCPGYHNPPTCTTYMGGGSGGCGGHSITGFPLVTIPTGYSGLYGPTA